MEIKKLNINEYSVTRQEAMKELYGENWKDILLKKEQQLNNINKNSDKLDLIANYCVEIVDMFCEEEKHKSTIISRAYRVLKDRKVDTNNDKEKTVQST